MNHPHHHPAQHDVAPQVLPEETKPIEGNEYHDFSEVQLTETGRGLNTPIAHVDDFGFITVEETADAQPTEVQVTAASDGGVRDGDPDTRSLYERYPGNYPFPVYHRTGKKLPNGKDVIATTIPPQPLNWVSDRKKFDVEVVGIVARELGYNYRNSKFAHFIKRMIPQMVAS